MENEQDNIIQAAGLAYVSYMGEQDIETRLKGAPTVAALQYKAALACYAKMRPLNQELTGLERESRKAAGEAYPPRQGSEAQRSDFADEWLSLHGEYPAKLAARDALEDQRVIFNLNGDEVR